MKRFYKPLLKFTALCALSSTVYAEHLHYERNRELTIAHQSSEIRDAARDLNARVSRETRLADPRAAVLLNNLLAKAATFEAYARRDPQVGLPALFADLKEAVISVRNILGTLNLRRRGQRAWNELLQAYNILSDNIEISPRRVRTKTSRKVKEVLSEVQADAGPARQ